MQSWCSLHGHPAADLSGTVTALKGIYAGALSEIPYLMGGKTSSEIQNSDRDEAIKRYREIRARAMKADVNKPEATVKPMVANKHKV